MERKWSGNIDDFVLLFLRYSLPDLTSPLFDMFVMITKLEDFRPTVACEKFEPCGALVLLKCLALAPCIRSKCHTGQ